MAWYFYVLEFLSGALLANGVPHFVQGVSGEPFQSPFAKPPGVGESSPVTNVIWGMGNLLAGAYLLHRFMPYGASAPVGWMVAIVGAILLSLQLAWHFGKVRAKRRSS